MALRTIALSDHVAKKPTWIWEGRIPRGGITLVEGDPQGGKSSLISDVAARLTTGRPMFGSATCTEPESVVLLQAEDTWTSCSPT
jgi:KaiC/GvpD/RAD55 family RecA-like ATPase